MPPFVDQEILPWDAVQGQTPIVPPTPANPEEVADPSLREVVGAAFRQSNIIGSLISNETLFDQNRMESPDYSAWAEIQGTPYEQYAPRFVRSNNATFTAKIKGQIDQELADREALQASGWTGTVVEIGAAVLDPINLVPGATAIKAVKGGYKLNVRSKAVKAGLTAATVGGVSVAAQEAVLQGTQELRTGQETAINVGAGVILGGALGYGVTKLLTPKEVKVTDAGFRKVLAEQQRIVRGESTADSVGAAANPDVITNPEFLALEREILSPKSGASAAVQRATRFINPQSRLATNPSPTARRLLQELSGGPLTLNADVLGRTFAPSVDAEARRRLDGALFNTYTSLDQIYVDAKKAAQNIPADEFYDRVFRASSNGDVDPQGNEYVTRAAQVFRQYLDTFGKEAEQLGLIDRSEPLANGAKSYSPSIFNRDAMRTREFEMKSALKGEQMRLLEVEHAKDAQKLASVKERVERDVAELSLPPEQRAARAEELRRRGAELEATQIENFDRYNDIRDLRAQARTAQLENRPEDRKRLLDEAKRMEADGGDVYKAFVSELGELRRTRRNLGQGSAAMQTKIDRLTAQIANIEQANTNDIARFGRRAQIELERLDRLSPELKAAKIEDLSTKLQDLGRKAEQRQAKAEEALAKFEEARSAAFAKVDAEAAAAKESSAEYDEALARQNIENEYGPKEKAAIDAALKAEAATAEKLQRVAKRLEAVEGLDVETLAEEVRLATQGILEETASRTLRRGSQWGKKTEQLASLDPLAAERRIAARKAALEKAQAKYDEKWNFGTGGAPEFSTLADDILNHVWDAVLGRNKYATNPMPDHMVAITTGPFRERRWNMPDTIRQELGLVHTDARHVIAEYGRMTSGEIELKRRFGDATMSRQIKDVASEYASLREMVSKAETPDQIEKIVDSGFGAGATFREWMSGQNKTQATKELAFKFLQGRETETIRDVQALRDIIRGTYRAPGSGGDMDRWSRIVSRLNFIRAGGTFLFSSLAEMLNPALVHGFRPFFQDGVAPLVRNIGKYRVPQNQARDAQLATEAYLNYRTFASGDLFDPYAAGSTVERLLAKGAMVGAKWNGLAHWTDLQQVVASNVTRGQILRSLNSKSEKSRTFLSSIGISERDADTIKEFVDQYYTNEAGIHAFNADMWTRGLEGTADFERAQRAADIMRGAIYTDVHNVIPRAGAADVPLFARTPLGRLFFQFGTFNFAAHQRVTLRGLESPLRAATVFPFFVAAGAAQSYLRALYNGEDARQNWLESAQNPGFVIGQGVTSLAPLFVDWSDKFEKLSGLSGEQFNPIKDPLLAAFPGSSQQGQASRFSQGQAFRALGPTGGLVVDVAGAAAGGVGLVTEGEASKSQISAAQRLVPYANFPGVKQLFNALEGDTVFAPEE